MLGEKRCEVRVLVFGASLRQGSLNDRLATLVAKVVEENGAVADLATMMEFDCPAYDQDVERDEGVPLGAERLRERLTTADAFMRPLFGSYQY